MIETIPQNHFEVNTYILFDHTKECVLVDACAQSAAEEREILSFIASKGLKVKHILLTHAHIDHLCGAEFACREFDLPLTLGAEGIKILETATWQASAMGFKPIDTAKIKTNAIVAGDEIHFGESTLKAVESSGHCPGSLSFYNSEEGYIITGDALFCQSIGRTDLEGGDLDLLLSNIKNNILTLPDTTRVYPGHGPSSTVKEERDYNPFFL